MLTNTWNYDKVNKLSTNSKSVEKDLKKSWKKFLTNANEFDKINELLTERTAKNLDN